MKRSRSKLSSWLAAAVFATTGAACVTAFAEETQNKPAPGAKAAPPHAAPQAATPHAAMPHAAAARPGVAPGQSANRGMDHARPAGNRRMFVHHDFAHFDARERGLWTAGRWNQTCFNGRCGYWWLAGGTWYFYAAPVYPYPTVVSDVVFAEPVVVAPVAAPPPPPTPQPPLIVQPSAAAQTRYYCDNPAGYFPAVQSCSGQWRPVAQ